MSWLGVNEPVDMIRAREQFMQMDTMECRRVAIGYVMDHIGGAILRDTLPGLCGALEYAKVRIAELEAHVCPECGCWKSNDSGLDLS